MKDRLKAEQEGGLVLSPQRRSFLSGCHVSNSMGGAGQDGQEVGAEDGNGNGAGGGGAKGVTAAERDDRNARRIGSGRILSRGDREQDFDRAGGPRRGAEDRFDRFHGRDRDDRYGGEDRRGEHFRGGDRRDRDRWDRDERFDRRGAAFQGGRGGMRPDKMDRRMGDRPGGRYGQRRSEGGGDEPEWMSVSVDQDEMMELRGFEDSPEKERKEILAAGEMNEKAKKENVGKEPGASKQQQQQPQQQQDGFNIDDFLKMDSIPGLANILADDDPLDAIVAGRMMDGGAGTAASDQPPQESRFSKFFKRPLEQPKSSSSSNDGGAARRGSIQDELQQHQGGFQQQQQEPSIKIPSPGDAGAAKFYFAPISPAAKTDSRQAATTQQQQQQQQRQQQSNEGGNMLMDLIRGGDSGMLTYYWCLKLINSILLLPIIGGEGRVGFSLPAGVIPPFAQGPQGTPALSQLQGKDVKSVEELEADLKQMTGLGDNRDRQQQQQQKQQENMARQQQQQQQQQGRRADEDDSAFKKFVSRSLFLLFCSCMRFPSCCFCICLLFHPVTLV